MSKFIELLKVEASEMATAFAKASIEGEGTPQEVADRREEVVKKFLTKYFPYPYRVVKGNIIDSFGNRSNSIDCLVLNPSHPYTVDPDNDRASIIFADGVDYAIEVKPNMANKNEIERSLQQIRSVKKLKRVRCGGLLEPNSVAHENAKQIPAFIFADETYADIRTLIEHITNYYVENKVPKREQFDLLVINNRAIVYNCGEKAKIKLGTTEGIAYAETGENTLATFLVTMNIIPQSQPEISKNIIRIYLEKLPGTPIYEFRDLNIKLNAIENVG